MRNFTETQLSLLRDAVTDRIADLRPEAAFVPHASLNLRPKHPVIMIPGFITSALEMWEGEPCMSDHFRKRIWGSTTMLKLMLRDPTCWLRHMSLMNDGQDPPGIRLRPASGLEAGDFFVGQFFVWARIIEELGRIGYDKHTMDLMSFDWRLSLVDLERRDRYFTRLADAIEQYAKIHGEKVVIVTHSYGATVLHFFLKWAEHHKGSGFVADKIKFVYHVGGTFLGVGKAVAALLTGEMKDSDLGAFQPVLDAVMNAEERAKLWRSWGGLYSMLPKGGSRIFKDARYVIDGVEKTLEQVYEIMKAKIPGFHQMVESVDYGEEIQQDGEGELVCPDKKIPTTCYRKSWTSVLRAPLPRMPDIKIFCVYGNSIPTEASHHFVTAPDGALKIDVEANDEEATTIRGVRRTDGDGSVPIESLSYPCETAWKQKIVNPHNVEVIQRVIPHDKEPNLFSRYVLGYSGKIESSEHVDILGHHSVLEDVVALASGRLDLVNL